MKNIIYLFLVLLFTSCGATYQLSTLNYDPIYGPDGTEIKVDTIDSEFQLARKFRTDDTFRWNFAQFAMRQDMRWNYDFYFNNRMHRSGFGSPFAFYWNSNQYWWNWANNSHFNMGFNHRDIFGFYGNSYGWNNGYYGYGWNNYGWNGYNNWNNGPWNNSGYNAIWNSSRRNNGIAYINGRRGSNITNYNNRTNSNIENSIAASKNKPRKNFVIEEDGVRWYSSSENDVDNSNLNSIVSELRNSGLKVNIINNNNNDQIIRSNPRNYLRTESGGNGGRSWSGENVPVKPVKPIISTSNQSGQIYRGSGSSGVQQSGGSSTSSRQNGGGTSRQRN